MTDQVYNDICKSLKAMVEKPNEFTDDNNALSHSIKKSYEYPNKNGVRGYQFNEVAALSTQP